MAPATAANRVDDPAQLLPADPPAAKRIEAKLAAFERASGVKVLLRLTPKAPPAEEDKVPGAYMRAWATRLGVAEKGVLVAYFAEEEDWRIWIGDALAARFAGKEGTVLELTKNGAIHDAKEALFAAAQATADAGLETLKKAAGAENPLRPADRVRFMAQAIVDNVMARLGPK
jgi:hypothetical protein